MKVEKTVVLPVVGQVGDYPLIIWLTFGGAEWQEVFGVAQFSVDAVPLDEIQQCLPHGTARGGHFGLDGLGFDHWLYREVKAVSLPKVLGFDGGQHGIGPAVLCAPLVLDGGHGAENYLLNLFWPIGDRGGIMPEAVARKQYDYG